MCDSSFSVEMNDPEIEVKVKARAITAYAKHINRPVTIEKCTLIITGFKTKESAEYSKAHIQENILDDMCENLRADGGLNCHELFDCCDCGGNNCGCGYCFSCNGCSECTGIPEED